MGQCIETYEYQINLKTRTRTAVQETRKREINRSRNARETASCVYKSEFQTVCTYGGARVPVSVYERERENGIFFSLSVSTLI